ncbi:MAG: TetR/AcrR family transcriptional regulator [Verrucomicrobia bacterium]|nr:TetR/AcrR family transcriptional regulator [Verrucomicrobiota bacterium]
MRQRLSREEKRQETKEKLLRSAEQLFNQGGYEKASVDLIAENAGFSKGAFYSNFDSKEAIFLELLEASKRRKIEALEYLVAQDMSADQLLAAIRNSEPDSDFDFAQLAVEFQLQASRDPTFAKAYAKLNRNYRDSLIGVLEKLYAKLGKTPPTPVKDLADILMATISGLLLQAAETPANVRKRLISEAMLLILGISRDTSGGKAK